MRQALEDRRISQDYFRWLCDKVMIEQDTDSASSYMFLADRMYRIRFNDNVPNDRNRAADGVQLRHDFLQEYATNYEQLEVADLLYSGANVLEVLIGLAQRADFEWNLGVMNWFGKFLQNLKLNCYADSEIEPGDINRIGRILSKFNERRYVPSGRGGLFPLKGREWEDQRSTELWYQLSHYIEENRR